MVAGCQAVSTDNALGIVYFNFVLAAAFSECVICFINRANSNATVTSDAFVYIDCDYIFHNNLPF
jgi:hypothetical protein